MAYKKNKMFMSVLSELCGLDWFNYLVSEEEAEEIYKQVKTDKTLDWNSYGDVRYATYEVMVNLGYNY